MKNFEVERKLPDFLRYLRLEEFAENSINGYKKDLHGLFSFLQENFDENCEFEKEMLIKYKETLMIRLKPSSVNRKIAAINKFLEFCEFGNLKLKSLKIQEQTTAINTLTEREFARLIESALRLGKRKIALIMLTLASVGIRISELQFITAETVRFGKVTINGKGKVRTVIIPAELREKLAMYCVECDIKRGAIFLGKTGQPISRPYISCEMKAIAKSCNVDENKVFPHNLRHYFARKFLDCGNELSDLADVLGHTSVNTTRRYLRVSEKMLQRQMSKVKIFEKTKADEFFALWAG